MKEKGGGFLREIRKKIKEGGRGIEGLQINAPSMR